MAATVCNIAKGKVAQLASLPATNDAIIVIPLETAGIESDATLQDYDTVDALLAGATNEQTTMGRKTAASVTVTVDDTNNRVDVDCADITWAAATGNACSRLLFAYDPDTTGGTDADLIPLAIDDFVVTPAGGDITYVVAAGGWFRAS
jgi:hypothetical protein